MVADTRWLSLEPTGVGVSSIHGRSAEGTAELRGRRLRDVFPEFATDRFADSRLPDAQQGGDLSLRHALKLWTVTAQPTNKIVRKARPAMALAASIPSLGFAVGHVVGLSAKKEVLNANTGRVVAPVQNTESVWYFTVLQCPRNAMGALDSRAQLEASVSSRKSRSLPRVAPGGLTFTIDLHLEPASDSAKDVAPGGGLKHARTPTTLFQSKHGSTEPQDSDLWRPTPWPIVCASVDSDADVAVVRVAIGSRVLSPAFRSSSAAVDALVPDDVGHAVVFDGER